MCLASGKSLARRLRELVGVVVKDLPRDWRALAAADRSYLAICNRHESLVTAPHGLVGYRCDWQWTSELHAPRVLPVLGRRLMERALKDHPIRRSVRSDAGLGLPELSFVIGHRGSERVPHLLATLEGIAGQRRLDFECIVVEQEARSRLDGVLPTWVRHLHTPPPTPDTPYSRSWAFNCGAEAARGALLVLHDNDMLVPADYGAEILARAREGYEVINLKRFIFYLGESHTRAFFRGSLRLLDAAPERILQNAEAGGSVALTRAAFDRIGGMDESFIGWGGEDNEFWERAQTCRVWPYGYLPLVHLWHPNQPGKQARDNPMIGLHRTLAELPVAERIARLCARERGRPEGPHGQPPG